MPLDPQLSAHFPAPPDHWYSDEQYTMLQLRSRVKAASAEKPLGKVPLHRVEDRLLPGPIPIRIYRPFAADAAPQPAMVFFHGGGFVLGDLDSHDGLCRALAALTPCLVVAVGYRLAPEHPFPAAVLDALAAVQWVSASSEVLGVDPSRLAVAGDSAGGSLAAVVTQLARSAGGPAIAFQLLIYPALGGTPDRYPSITECAEGYGLSTRDIQFFLSSYLGKTGAHRSDTRFAPILEPDLAGLPPALVVSAEFDVLRDEDADYAQRLAVAGVPTVYRCYEGQVHGFLNLRGITTRSVVAVKECAAALAKALGITTNCHSPELAADA